MGGPSAFRNMGKSTKESVLGIASTPLQEHSLITEELIKVEEVECPIFLEVFEHVVLG